MPDRLLYNNPRRAAYVMIFLSLIVTGLAIEVITLHQRVGHEEQIRIAEKNAAKERATLECRSSIESTRKANILLDAIRDLAVLPQQSIRDQLNGPLTEKERRDKLEALARYKAAEDRIHTFPVPTCVTRTQ